ncbi:MAG: GNAT family N-acetyltransferase [Hyphomicrobiales bacterium]|nr:GNAT family N-acetyltransferase [Hyphomicrobiales bacterium]
MERPAPSELATVRRYEAAGFRAWPAASVHYDGTWLIRLTAGNQAKRLNSVNPLDPSDGGRLGDRIARAARRFEAYGRPLVFRMSPLSGRVLSHYLDDQGWSRFEESLILRMPLSGAAIDDALYQIPLKDVGRFINAAIRTENLDPALRPGLSEIIGSIEPRTGLFVMEQGGTPVTTAICVQDNDIAGLFKIATAAEERGKGYGRRTILSALKWARSHGAREAWMQVDAGNAVALGVYRSLGFTEAYRYHYRRPPEA